MAEFNTTGIDGLSLSLEEVADLPEEVLLNMLTAEGAVVRAAQVRKINSLGLVDTKQLENSIVVDKKLRVNRNGAGTERYLLVYPRGERVKKSGGAQMVTHKYKKKRSGKAESTHAATNAEVGFVNEYGAPKRGIRPTQWMRAANELSAGDAVAAAERVYSEYLRSKGL